MDEKRYTFPEAEAIEETEEERPLTREEGERFLRDTLVPALQDVKEAERRGERFPDAHELLKELEAMVKEEPFIPTRHTDS